MHPRFAVLLLAILSVVPVSAKAITLTYNAVVTGSSFSSRQGVSVGDTIGGTITYSPVTPLGAAGFASYVNTVTHTATNGLFPEFTSFSKNFASVFDNYDPPLFDGYRFVLEHLGSSYFALDMQIYSTDLNTVTSYDLPTALDISDFDFRAILVLDYDGPDGTGFVFADVTSLSVSVPEPATAGLLGIGILGLGYIRHRGAKIKAS